MNVLNQILAWVGFVAVMVAIVILGWNEPLSYRFMSPTEVREARAQRMNYDGAGGSRPVVNLRNDGQIYYAPPAAPAAPAPSASWRPRGTALDRAPYETVHGDIIYSENYDKNKMGARTETGKLPNKTVTGSEDQ